MKKSILTIALMALVSMTASAVSIKWSSSALAFDGASLANVSSGLSAYLLYLGEGNTTLSTYTIDETFTTASVGTEVQEVTKTAKSGKTVTTVPFTFDFGDYNNGDAFAMLVSYKAGDDTYWNLSSVVNTISGLENASSIPVFTEFAFNNNKAVPLNGLSAGGGWVKAMVVPEPATGALALAGLALLFRRKRA